MATKSKRPRPALTFITYVLAFEVLLFSILGLVVQCSSYATDYKKTSWYTDQTIQSLIRAGYAYTADISPAGWFWNGSGIGYDWTETSDENLSGWSQGRLQREGNNLSYLFISRDGERISNGTDAVTAEAFIEEAKAGLAKSRENYNRFRVQASGEGYDHLLVLRGSELYEVMNTRMKGANGYEERTVPLMHTDYMDWSFDNGDDAQIEALTANDATICLAIRAEGAFANNYGSIYRAYYEWFLQSVFIMGIFFVALGALILVIGARLQRQSMEIARAKLAAFSGWFWVEFKIICFITLCLILFVCSIETGEIGVLLVALFPSLWCFWLVGNDLRYNGAAVFRHNSITSLKKLLDRLDSRYPFCARMKRRILLLILGEAALVFLCFFFVLSLGAFGLFLSLFIIAVGIFLLIYYIKTYYQDVDDFAQIIDYVAQIHAGSAQQPLELPTQHAFSELARNLDNIHSGMAHMVEDRVRNEQMKVELITNISHDLKTPLTSIINYVELLKGEDLTPGYANEYVLVLQTKAQRLKNLVQDLFEISKANSGAIDLNLEQLCVRSLVEQTVAELDQRTNQVGVEMKLNLCPPPVVVRADGKKLHRVFENLLGNALKYSLAGTRVYIDVSQQGQEAVVTIKNVAGYEMTFTADDIVERFQRGDTSRTGEGSGLGLAIAKSFLELNGGSLEITLDGDLFKVTVRLPLYVSYQEHAAASQTATRPQPAVSVTPPVSDAPPVSIVPPVSDPPVSDAPPVSIVPPVSVTPPVSDAPPVSATIPVSDVPPVSDAPPVSVTTPVSDAPPVNDAPPVSVTPPVGDAPPAAQAEAMPQPEAGAPQEGSNTTPTAPESKATEAIVK